MSNIRKFLLGLYLFLSIGIVFSEDIARYIPNSIVPFEQVQRPGSYVVIVDDTARQSPVTTRIIGNKDFIDGLKDRGLHYRFWPTEKNNTYTQMAQKMGLPAVFIVGPTGDLLEKRQLPPTVDLLDGIIKKNTGL